MLEALRKCLCVDVVVEKEAILNSENSEKCQKTKKVSKNLLNVKNKKPFSYLVWAEERPENTPDSQKELCQNSQVLRKEKETKGDSQMPEADHPSPALRASENLKEINLAEQERKAFRIGGFSEALGALRPADHCPEEVKEEEEDKEEGSNSEKADGVTSLEKIKFRNNPSNNTQLLNAKNGEIKDSKESKVSHLASPVSESYQMIHKSPNLYQSSKRISRASAISKNIQNQREQNSAKDNEFTPRSFFNKTFSSSLIQESPRLRSKRVQSVFPVFPVLGERKGNVIQLQRNPGTKKNEKIVH